MTIPTIGINNEYLISLIINIFKTLNIFCYIFFLILFIHFNNDILKDFFNLLRRQLVLFFLLLILLDLIK